MSKDIPGYVDPYPGKKGDERIVRTCAACLGTGLYSGPTSLTDSQGRPYCFACKGAGRTSVLVASARSTARRRARQAIEASEAAAAAVARHATFLAAIGDTLDEVRASLAPLRDRDPLHDQGAALIQQAEGLTVDAEQWLTEARAWLDAIAEREAAKRPVPDGRVELEGVIRTRKWVENAYGGTLKMLLVGEGWKVWGSVPSALREAGVEMGDTVRFTATVTASDDDPSFGFFSRPTGAAVVSA